MDRSGHPGVVRGTGAGRCPWLLSAAGRCAGAWALLTELTVEGTGRPLTPGGLQTHCGDPTESLGKLPSLLEALVLEKLRGLQ